MPLSSTLLALCVVIVWGLSFSAIKFGVDEMPPLFLTALRFALAAVPAVFFMPRQSAWRYLIGFGTVLGVVKFSAMFLAIKAGMPTGLSSIVASLTPQTGAATALVVQNAFVNAVKQDSRLYHVGYRLPMAGHKLYVAYSHLDDRRGADADTSSFGAVFTYSFSARTDLNLVLTRFVNKNLAQAAPGQAGSLGGVTASAGTDSNAFAIGMRHRF